MNKVKKVKQIKENLLTRDVVEASKAANELIKAMGIHTFPVPIVTILNDLGCRTYVSSMPTPNIEGFTIVEPSEAGAPVSPIISVDKKESYEKQRFIYAHELGHLLFDYHPEEVAAEPYFDTYELVVSPAKEEMEVVPNRFAYGFLMPEEIFIKRYKDLMSILKGEERVVMQLAVDFQVDYVAALTRLKFLGKLQENGHLMA